MLLAESPQELVPQHAPRQGLGEQVCPLRNVPEQFWEEVTEQLPIVGQHAPVCARAGAAMTSAMSAQITAQARTGNRSMGMD